MARLTHPRKKHAYDAVVVGSGPNGLAAAITVAKRGGSVLLLEGAPTIGGGMRSAEQTLPGFVHDVCAAVFPLGVSSPFFRTLPLEAHGLQWIHAPRVAAHPLEDGTAALLDTSIERTVESLGADGPSYEKLIRPLVPGAESIIEEIMRPMMHLPSHPLLLARFGLKAILSARALANRYFQGEHARALFAGVAGHAMIPLTWSASSATTLTLLLAAHLRGWPIVRGGSQKLADALASYLVSLGGEICTDTPIASLDELPDARWVFLDVTPTQFRRLAETRLSESQKRRLQKFRHGMAVYKIDYALSGPIPWTACECARAGTVHLGATFGEIQQSELDAQKGRASQRPYVLLTQPSLFDPSRAPPGQHTAWAYCHVPHGSSHDMSDAIDSQIERFAPGFRASVLARKITDPAALERSNPNYVGGDIGGGALDLRQLLFRPRLSLSPYSTPLRGVFLCSSSTPPGPGVHGMCGHLAALAAIGA